MSINKQITRSIKVTYPDTDEITHIFSWTLFVIETLRLFIVYEHWPETHEFITRTVELWNKWIRLSCYYNTVQNMCPLYTYVTPILLCIGPCNLFRRIWSMFPYNTHEIDMFTTEVKLKINTVLCIFIIHMYT
mgnify:FL=1